MKSSSERVRREAAVLPSESESVERIVGLFPKPVFTAESDLQAGLDNRARLIEGRAEAVAEVAVEIGQPWAAQLGRPPLTPCAATNACQG